MRREQVRAHEMDWRLPARIGAQGLLRVEQLMHDALVQPAPGKAERPWQVLRSREQVKKGTKTKDGNHGLRGENIDATALNSFARRLQQRIFSDR